MVAKAGADYVSPFVGRLDDRGHEGIDLVKEILAIYKNYNFETQIITASIHSPRHVKKAAKIGAHLATVPFEIIEKMSSHPLTDNGIEKFLDDRGNK